MSHVKCDMWHVTRDLWHMTCERWGEVNLLSKFQRPSSYGFWLKVCWRYFNSGWLTELIRSSQSAPEYSCWKRHPTINRRKKLWIPLSLVPKKTMSVIAFQTALTLDVKNLWFGCQVAVCVKKRHKNAIFWCSWFQNFNFDCLLHKLLICSPTTENIFNFVGPLWTKSSIMISGTQIYITLFLASSHKSWR